MPSQPDINLSNTASKNRQRASRESREAKRSRKDDLKSALAGASSTSDRREIKEQYAAPYQTPKPEVSLSDIVGYNGTVNSLGEDINASGSSEGGSGGGTFELDIVDGNTAGRASFTGGGII
jgi:hypothetical protein